MTNPTSTVLRAGACALSLLATWISTASTSAQRTDAAGRDLAYWARDPGFDHTHMRLELDFPDINSRNLVHAICTLDAIALGEGADTMTLDAHDMHVERVSVDGTSVWFREIGEHLELGLPRFIPGGDRVTVEVRYTLADLGPTGEGLSWSPPTRRARGPSEESPMIHTQGQPTYARRWFPCYDEPGERLSTEIIAIVADGFETVSNGVLVSRDAQPDGRIRWHWRQARPHAPYLVSLVVGKFEVVEVGGPASARPGLPMPVYTPFGTGEQVRRSFARTPEMVAHFERLFDEPYPWDKYSQAIVRDFKAGAMENTSATTFFPMAAGMGEGELDSIIVHELVHQWTGDLLTCRRWSELWLNEGWATFGEALWAEYAAEVDAITDGDSSEEARRAGRRAYLRTMTGNMDSQRLGNRTSGPDEPALASNFYTNAEQNFMKINNPYSRGACVLHMLRERLGDDAFFAGVRLYIDRHKDSAVESRDFRLALEDASGQSLERFFDQWVYRPGVARASVELAWDEGDSQPGGTLRVGFTQTQIIDEHNPAYAMVVPLVAKFEDAPGKYLYLEVDTRETLAEFVLPARPSSVSIDPQRRNMLETKIILDLDESAPPATEASR